MAMKDAVREGDGEAMLMHWNINVIQFHNKGHNKYRILAHLLAAGKAVLCCVIIPGSCLIVCISIDFTIIWHVMCH